MDNTDDVSDWPVQAGSDWPVAEYRPDASELSETCRANRIRERLAEAKMHRSQGHHAAADLIESYAH